MADLFDVFVGFDMDFKLTVTHNGNKIIVNYLPLINGQVENGIAPFTVTWMKNESINVEEVRLKVKQALEHTADHIDENKDSIKEFLAGLEKKASAGAKSKTAPLAKAKPDPNTEKAKELSLKCSKHITQDKVEPSKVVLKEVESLKTEIDNWMKTKPEIKDKAAEKVFKENFQGLTTLLDKLQPTLF